MAKTVPVAARRAGLALLVGLLFPSGLRAQSVPDEAVYRAVLDAVFRLPDEPDGGATSLRFLDVEDGEMAIVIRHHTDEYAITVQRLAPGEPSIWIRLSRLADGGRGISVEQAAGLSALRRTSTRVRRSSKTGRLIAEGDHLRVDLRPREVVFLHGSQYSVTRRSSASTVTASFFGPRDPARSDEPVIQWMARVLREVQSMEQAGQFVALQ